MKALGVNIPDGVMIAVDVAQVYASGAALSSAIDAYEGIDNVKNVAGAGTATVGAALALGQQLGWIDANSDAAQILKVGVDVALIISSGGLNIAAWISLVMDFIGFSEGNKAKAAMLAQQGLMNQIQARFTPQAQVAAATFKQFQESQNLGFTDPNYLSIFGMVGKIAEVAPDLWPQYFPNFGWAPTTIWTLSSNSSSRTWYGETATDHADYTFTAFTRLPKSEIQDVIYRGLILPYLAPYKTMNDAYQATNKASITTLSILGALQGFDRLEPGHDYAQNMRAACLSPLDFGDAVFQNWLDDYAKANKNVLKSNPIQISGKGVAQVKSDFILNNLKGLSALDNAGRMDILASIPAVQPYLKEMFSFPELNPATGQIAGSNLDKQMIAQIKGSTAFLGNGKFGSVNRDPREQIHASLTDQINAGKWRSTKNYFACLAMIDQLRHDTWFSDWITNGSFGNTDFQSYGFLHTIAQVDQLARSIQLKTFLRSANTLALNNIAGFFETTPNKLIKIPAKDGKPITYRVKG